MPGNIDGTTAWSSVSNVELGNIVLDRAEDSIENDFGLIDPIESTISWTISANGNTPLDGYTVTLLDENGNILATTMTDVNGNYTFGDLAAWAYSVSYTNIPWAYDPNSPQTIENIQLGREEDSAGNDFSLVSWSLAGTVYYDAYDNNFYDEWAEDNGIAGQTVTLTDGTNVWTTTTDADGNYDFWPLPAGEYTLSYANSSDYTPNSAQAGSEWGNDSDEMIIAQIMLGTDIDGVNYDFWLVDNATTQPVASWNGWGTSSSNSNSNTHSAPEEIIEEEEPEYEETVEEIVEEEIEEEAVEIIEEIPVDLIEIVEPVKIDIIPDEVKMIEIIKEKVENKALSLWATNNYMNQVGAEWELRFAAPEYLPATGGF